VNCLFRLSQINITHISLAPIQHEHLYATDNLGYIRYRKEINFSTIKKYLLSLFTIFVLLLGGCSSDGDDDPADSKINISGTMSNALIDLLNLDQTNILVEVIVNGGTPRACGNLSVNTTSGTYTCSIALPAGSQTLTLVYSVIDGTYGIVQVAETGSLVVNVLEEQPANADFTTATITYDDDDTDSISNLVELNEGSDPEATSYYVGGNVTGMVGTNAVLQMNAGNNLTIAGDGSFNFVPAVADSTGYTVTVLTQPGSPSQTCTVNNGTGTVSGANVTNIQIICPCVIGFSLIGSCTLE